MNINEIGDHASLAAITPEWEALSQRVAGRNPFVTPQFMLPYLEYIGVTYDYRVLAARDGGRLVGLSPTFARRVGRPGLRIRRISFPTHGTSPPFELLVEEGREDVAKAFAEHWRVSRDWDLIELQNVPSTSPTEGLLRAATSGSVLRLSGTPGRASLYVSIVGTWEDYWKSISKNVRAASKRALRRCMETGETRLVAFPGDVPDVARATDWVADVTRRSWKTPDGGAAEREQSMARFLGSLAAAGMLDIRFVMIDDRPIAYLINILYRNQLNAYHTAYDLAYMSHGPTLLLLQESINECYRRGYDVYDLLGERQQHLRRWTSEYVRYHDLRITRDTPLARMRASLYCRARDWRLARVRRSTEEHKAQAKSAVRTEEAGESGGGAAKD